MAFFLHLRSRVIVALALLALGMAGVSLAHDLLQEKSYAAGIEPNSASGDYMAPSAWNDEETGRTVDKSQPGSSIEEDRLAAIFRASSGGAVTAVPMTALPFLLLVVVLTIVPSSASWENAASGRPTIILVETPHKTGPPAV